MDIATLNVPFSLLLQPLEFPNFNHSLYYSVSEKLHVLTVPCVLKLLVNSLSNLFTCDVDVGLSSVESCCFE